MSNISSVIYLTLVLNLFSICLGGCSKNEDPPIVPPIPDTPAIDYKKYDFGNMAAISGHSIEDTIWDSGRKTIVGFKLGKSPKHLFLYPHDTDEMYPIASSTVSANSWDKIFESALYLPESDRRIPRFGLNAYDASDVQQNFLLTDFNVQQRHVENFLSKQGKLPYNGHKDFIYSFYDYENLKLLFGKNIDIKQLFNIKKPNYPKIEKEGILYYAFNGTISLRSTYMDRDYSDYFPIEQILDKNIARIHFIDYGKIAMMAVDGEASLIKPIITKLSNDHPLTDKEKGIINKASIHFHYYGYTDRELSQTSSNEDNLRKVEHFVKVAIKVEKLTFDMTSYGKPLQFELTTHSQNLDRFKETKYFNQIIFKQ